MEILIVHHCDSWGGAGVSLVDACKMLKVQNTITVLVPHIQSPVADELRKVSDIKIISLEDRIGMISAYNGGPKTISRTFYLNYRQIFKNRTKLSQVFSEGKFDMVLLNSITLSWVAKLAKRHHTKVVCYVRETAVNTLGFQLSLWNLRHYCSGVLYISEYDRKTLQVPVPTAVVYDCYDIDKAKKYRQDKVRIENNMFSVAFLGGDDPLKGYDILENAMRKLSSEPIYFMIAGNVAQERQLISPKISYFGKISDVSSILSNADVLVFPSVKGHQGRPIFEAGAFEVPVIVSNFPQTADEAMDQYNALTFQPSDAAELAGKIMWMYQHPEERRLMGKRNYQNTFEKHSIVKNAERLNRFLIEMQDGVK